MENKEHTSFIPKTKMPRESSASFSGGSSIFFMASFIIFLIVASMAGGVFFYNRYLDREIENKKTSLERSKEAFEPRLITELKNFDNKIKSAEEILNNHVSPVVIFKKLEENTLENIKFNSFKYTSDSEEGHLLNMEGEAKRFNSLALQSNIFGDVNFFENPVFSGLGFTQDGNVSFSFKSSLQLRDMLYEKVIEDEVMEEIGTENEELENDEENDTDEEPSSPEASLNN